jgi:hypothetical protein
MSEQRALPSQPALTASVSMSCAKWPNERGRSPMSFAEVALKQCHDFSEEYWVIQQLREPSPGTNRITSSEWQV